MPNAAATLSLTLGLFGVRRIPAMLNFTAGVDGLQSAIKAAQIKTILTSRAFLEKGKLTNLVEKLQGVTVVCLEDLRPRFTLADKLWLMLYAIHNPRAATLRSAPDDIAVVLFTSGSEGKPKGVVLSHKSILSDVDQALTAVDASPANKILSAMPIFHSFGLTAGFMLPILNGIRLFLYPSPLHYSIVLALLRPRRHHHVRHADVHEALRQTRPPLRLSQSPPPPRRRGSSAPKCAISTSASSASASWKATAPPSARPSSPSTRP